MWGYQKGYSWEDQVAEGAIGLAIVAGVFVAAVSLTVLALLLRHLLELFARHAFQNTTSAKVMWGTLAVLLTLWAVAGALAANPDLGPFAAVIAAWATLIAVIVWEFIDVRDGGHDQDRRGDVEELDSYLGEFAPATPSANGHAPAGVR